MPSATELNAITQPLQQLGIDLPADVVRLQAVAAAAVLPDPTEHLLSQLDSLTAGNVSKRLGAAALDEAAKAASVRPLQALHNALGAGMAAALRQAGDDLVADLRPQFDQATTAVTAAVGKVDPRDTAEQVFSKGQEAADAYVAVRDAVVILDTVLTVRVQLARLTGYGSTSVPVALIIDPKDAPDNAALRSADTLYRVTTRTGGRWLGITTAGYRLRLNTASEASALVQTAQAETNRVKAEAERPRPRGPRVTLIPR